MSTAKSQGERVDGRVERTARTRQKILKVTRDRILAGTSDPTAREIAQHAGITTRTLFRHFADMDSLYKSLFKDAEERIFAVMDETFPLNTDASGGWRERMEVVVDRRVRVYELVLPLYVSARWGRYRTSKPELELREGIRRRRRRLEEVLPQRIADDRVLFEAIDGVLSIEYWSSLRRDQVLSVERAAEVLLRAVNQLTIEQEKNIG